MIEREVVVRNRAGMHTRPAASLVKLAAKYKSEIELVRIRDNFKVNGKSIIGVMSLAAEQGCKVILLIDGEDEDLAADELVEFFEDGFGEM